MHYIPAGPGSFVNLPRAGGVAYAAQESWVQNETIRVRLIRIVHEVETLMQIRTTSCLGHRLTKSDTTRVISIHRQLRILVLKFLQLSSNVVSNETSACLTLVT